MMRVFQNVNITNIMLHTRDGQFKVTEGPIYRALKFGRSEQCSKWKIIRTETLIRLIC
jgi:hypothetical protein